MVDKPRCKIENELIEIDKKVNALNKKRDLVQAEEICKKGIKLAIKHNYQFYQAELLYQLGVTRFYMNDNQKSLEYCEEAYSLMKEFDDPTHNAEILNLISILYKKFHLFEKSLEYLYIALDIVETANDELGIAYITSNIGATYNQLNLPEKALKFCKKGLKISKKLNHQESMYFCINNIGAIYNKTQNKEKALKYAKLSLKISKKNNFNAEITRNYLNVASCYKEDNQLKKAKYYFSKALKHSYHSNAIEQRVISLIDLASLYVAENNLKKAKSYLSKAQELINKDQNRSLYMRFLSASIRYSVMCDDYKTAFEQLKERSELNEKTFNEDTMHKIASLESQFEIKNKEKEKEIYRLKNIELVKLNSELVSTNERLNKMHESKDTILRIVSHDLKNLIGTVSQVVEMVRLQELTEKVTKYVNTIDIATNRALHLVADILETNEIEAEGYTLELEHRLLDSYLESMIGLFIATCETKNIHFSLKLNAPKIAVHIHPEKMWQILNNLVHNAVKFTPKGGEIYLETIVEPAKTNDKSTKGYVYIKIVDSGIGIPQDHIPILFDKFTKAKRKGTDGELTTGIGLSIVKHLVELHNGEIFVSSIVDKGTEIAIKLPIK